MSKYPIGLRSAQIFDERQAIAAVLTLKLILVVWMQHTSVHKELPGLLLQTHFSLKKIIPKNYSTLFNTSGVLQK